MVINTLIELILSFFLKIILGSDRYTMNTINDGKLMIVNIDAALFFLIS